MGMEIAIKKYLSPAREFLHLMISSSYRKLSIHNIFHKQAQEL